MMKPICIVALATAMFFASGCGPSERERFEATEKLLSAWDKETNQSRAEYIRVLISEGADVNAKDKNGRTPLMLASDPEVIKVLRDAGANGHTTEEVAEATTKLHRSFKQLQNPWVDEVRGLISKGAEGELRLQRLEPGGYGKPEDLDYSTLAHDAREQFDAEAQRYLAADFPVILTEPGSLEETVEKLKSGTIDVSKSFKMSPGWKRNDPQKPQDENKA